MLKSVHFKPEMRALLLLFFPILLTQLTQAGYGLIDSVMASQVSPIDLAAISVGVGLWLPTYLTIMGVLMATTPLIAEAYGAKNTAAIPRITQQSLWLAGMLGLLGMLLLYLCPLLLFKPLGVPVNLWEKARTYMYGVSFSLPAMAMAVSLRSYAEAMHNARPVTIISLIGLVLLIPTNYLFIYGAGPIAAMGGPGCGVATSIVAWITLGLMALYLLTTPHYASIRFYQHFSFLDRKLLGSLLALGLPIGISTFFETSLFCFAALVLSPLGVQVLAAHQIALSISSVMFMIPMSVSIAISIRISMSMGEKNWELLIFRRKLGYLLATILACGSMVLLLLFRQRIIPFYTPDIAVQHLAATLLIAAIIYQLVDAWQATAAGCLRGMQDTRMTMWITFISYWLVAFPLGTYLSRKTPAGALGFWGALIVGLSFAAILLYYRVRYVEGKIIRIASR